MEDSRETTFREIKIDKLKGKVTDAATNIAESVGSLFGSNKSKALEQEHRQFYQEVAARNESIVNLQTNMHINSEFYDNKSFLKGESSLKHIELDLLGDINGKSILHLQCHFRQDTISLSRLGAKVTGIDLSDDAINYAQNMAKELETDTQFICSDIYELPNVLNNKFDLVFTGYGVIGWLPDMEQWAKIVAHYLKPGGQFMMVEFHPVVWMFDDDFNSIDYSYFKGPEIIEQLEGSYADRNAKKNDRIISKILMRLP